MNQESTYNTVIELWKDLSKEITSDKLLIELELYKKLLTFFQAGNYYYLIFNFNTREMDFVSPAIEKVLGYQSSEATIEFWFDKIHPDDQVYFANFEHESMKFFGKLPIEKIFNYKVQYDIRMRKKDGSYGRIMIQIITIQQYANGGIEKTLSLHTDIIHLKPTGKPTLSFIGLEGEPSFINVEIGKPLIPFKQVLSRREKEVLHLIMDGKQNKEIAEILNISKETVDRHRKNMITRNQLNNSSELIATALRKGWI
jgi:DNA-binding CsgD family transcriptional regulator